MERRAAAQQKKLEEAEALRIRQETHEKEKQEKKDIIM